MHRRHALARLLPLAGTALLLATCSETAAPDLQFTSDDPVDLGAVPVGALRTATITATNDGDAAARVLEVLLEDPNATFELASRPSLPTAVEPGSSVHLDVSFRAERADVFWAEAGLRHEPLTDGEQATLWIGLVAAAVVDGTDADGDGYTVDDGDCNDGVASIHPGAEEQCNGLDDDCDGSLSADELDADGDGWTGCDGDCDDGNADVYPGAPEQCDGLDDDCDGTVGDDVDADGDGHTPCQGDCDDGDAAIHPGGTELCDGLDNDCDGVVPDDEADADGDGHRACGAPADCDDGDPAVHPGAIEACNGIDDDCDGDVDEDTADDADGDGYNTCQGDCDDGDAATHPGAPEVCDGVDNDCDGSPGAGEIDVDGDGYRVCGGDCNDVDAAIHPGAIELCGGADENCDGVVDEPGADGCSPYHLDADGDGYGHPSDTACLCAPSAPYSVDDGDDCYDDNSGAFPGASSWYTVDRGDGSYDYDCDGLESLFWLDLGSCLFQPAGPTDPHGTCQLDTAGWAGTLAACGETRLWIMSCSGHAEPCAEVGFDRTQACQ